jgi:hypothetical protein
MKKTSASLSELMLAASEVAFACSENEREAYHLTQQALIEFIKRLPETSEFSDFSGFHSRAGRYLH